jgi:putative thioredoxin
MAISADTATFPAEVVDRSRRQPVVVDFWAEWCGPCHQLSPIIERVAERFAGDVALVKVDVDASPDLARQYRVQGIPAVKAFVDGAVAAEFTGVQPEPYVERFFAALAPSPSDRLVAEAREAADPEPLLRRALDAEPGHEQATVALAGHLADRGDAEEALALLEKVPEGPETRALRSRLRLAGAGEADLDGLRRDAATGDAAARVRLGRALAGRGSYDEAVEELLAALADRGAREEARHALIEVFDVLGSDHDLVRRSRPRLASMLYA